MLKVEDQWANIMVAIALALGTPFFVVFGALSDRIGRKKIIMTGCLVAAICYFPLFKALTFFANPDIFQAQTTSPIKVVADPATCSFQFDPIGKAKFTSSCDIAKSYLAKNGISYENEGAPAGTAAKVMIGNTAIESFEGTGIPADDFKQKADAFNKNMKSALGAAGYPEKANPEKTNSAMVILLLTILVIFVTLVYGPIAAFLVELFPTRIRYTSMSLPYHIGNGWFGGFLPPVAFAMVAATGDIFYGLWYPVVFALITFVVGSLFLPETKDWDLHQHD
jgi:nitrate/nitrite transporter NarK